MEVEKRIVLWCGNAPNQKALANKIYNQFGLSGIVIDKKKKATGGKKTPGSPLQKIYDYLLFRKIYSAWKRLQYYYDSRFRSWPKVPIQEVNTINCQETFEFTSSIHPHLIVVSGSGLVKEPLLNLPVEIGIMNLHTGLSPYVKGGPNCTNWCIANNEWNLVGNTIMWINAGIDTGNIIASEAIDIRSCSTLYQAHVDVMEHAHNLYLRAINYVVKNNPPYPSIPQEKLGKGRLFLTKMWNAHAKRQLLKNWRKREAKELMKTPQTISLPR